jgi:curved DNA-binding protein CbpA
MHAAVGRPDATFDVDAAALDRSYKDLQRLLHPDKFTARPEVTATGFELSYAATNARSPRGERIDSSQHVSLVSMDRAAKRE